MEQVPAHVYGIRARILESQVDGLAQQGWTRVFDKAAKVLTISCPHKKNLAIQFPPDTYAVGKFDKLRRECQQGHPKRG